ADFAPTPCRVLPPRRSTSEEPVRRQRSQGRRTGQSCPILAARWRLLTWLDPRWGNRLAREMPTPGQNSRRSDRTPHLPQVEAAVLGVRFAAKPRNRWLRYNIVMEDFTDLKRDALAQHLRKEIQGEVRFDHASRKLYSTDASIYQIEPLGVVIPRTVEDL